MRGSALRWRRYTDVRGLTAAGSSRPEPVNRLQRPAATHESFTPHKSTAPPATAMRFNKRIYVKKGSGAAGSQRSAAARHGTSLPAAPQPTSRDPASSDGSPAAADGGRRRPYSWSRLISGGPQSARPPCPLRCAECSARRLVAGRRTRRPSSERRPPSARARVTGASRRGVKRMEPRHRQVTHDLPGTPRRQEFPAGWFK